MFDNVQVGDSLTRVMGGKSKPYPGTVIKLTEETITCQFVANQSRTMIFERAPTMTFDRKTGISILGVNFGRIE